ncbi:MAG TPA: hypothetical protein VMJ75_29755 [Candidatus Acidoferrales bacterium]|nr:hypothetical protein [Candidatus Acidoferrales bacterium]
MDEFDALAVAVASEVLRSEAESPGSQDANLVKLAEIVLNHACISPEAATDTLSPKRCSPR